MARTSSERQLIDAIRQHQQGKISLAEQLYHKVLESEPTCAVAIHYLGVIAFQSGRCVEAVALIDRAIGLDAGQAPFHNNLGLALRALGRQDAALAAFERALQLRPSYADALSNLGNALAERGDANRAMDFYERALQLDPQHVDALYNWGNALVQSGRAAEALERYMAAVQILPQRPDIHNNLGNSLLALHRFAEAANRYELALRIKPDYAEAHYNLGVAWAEQDATEQARASFNQAARLRPDKTWWQLRAEFLWPPVFKDHAHIDQCRQRLAEALNRYAAVDLRLDWTEIAACGCMPPFNLPHQGRDNLPLKRQFAAVFERYFQQGLRDLLPEGTAAADGCGDVGSPRAPSDSRRRIGVVITRGHEAVFLKCMGEILNRLPATCFDVVVFCAASGLDRVRQSVRHADVSMTALPEQFVAAARTLAARRCDLLYYWEVGSDALNYFLPFLRLAPVQCTSWGTLVTSGVPEMDYYVSSALVETDEADQDYSEKLVRLRSLLACLPRTTLPQPVPDRAHFGLPEGKHLYVCPQNLLKFHPDFDAILAGILEADAEGLVVTKHGRWPRAGELLQQRFRQTLSRVGDRILMLPWQTHEAYLHLLALADVVLDTPHYGAGSSSYDVLSFNQPGDPAGPIQRRPLHLGLLSEDGHFRLDRRLGRPVRAIGHPGRDGP